MTVRFSGQRLDVEGEPTDADAFVATATYANVQPGSGPIALTHRIVGKASGRWKVTAEAMATSRTGDHRNAVRLPPAEGIGRSTLAPVATMRAPGVVPGSWPLLVGLGFILATIVLSLLARNSGMPAGTILALAAAAGALGLGGAKVYYWLTHRGQGRAAGLAGLSLQGFVITAIAVFVLGGWAFGVPIGSLLDATIPALLVGQAVGRLGCIFAGCCSGLP
ncbi:MAG: prolipoprotein diacylglyceryl transferase, partial [Demequina sp.]|nr:prolipoprotein diacylglyceryl transferase [Demequina sp.]